MGCNPWGELLNDPFGEGAPKIIGKRISITMHNSSKITVMK